MTQKQFNRRIHSKFKGTFTSEQIAHVVSSVFHELREIIREGDEIRIQELGRFYPKAMKERRIRGGIWQATEKEFKINAKTKVGFSSYPGADSYVSTPPTAHRPNADSLLDLFLAAKIS